MRYLVTGGGGFIGSNFVGELLERGEKVRVVDNFSTGRRENLKEFAGNFELVEGDIRSFWTMFDACKGVDYVIHLAALPSVFRSVEDPLTSIDININGTATVLEAARRQGVKKVMAASSSSVYGDTPTLPKHEGMSLSPLSPYAVSKLTGEHFCRIYHDLYGMTAISFRFFNVFGPKQNPDSEYAAVVPKFITSLLAGKQPKIYGDGEQSRDFTYIDNVIEAVLGACAQDKIKSGAYNLACGSQLTVNELLRQLREILGKQGEAIYVDARPGDVKHSFADISRLAADFGFKPSIGFEEGLQKTVAYFERENRLTDRVTR
ncbi:MAG: SDR family oxidoreductase [bacterium]